MPTICGEFTAAELSLHTDVFSLGDFKGHATASTKRKVRKIYLTGANAAVEATFDLYYGTRKQVIAASNPTTGLTVDETIGLPVCSVDWCYPDEKMMLVVTTAPTVNPMAIKVEIV